jgi:hypothetical protein
MNITIKVIYLPSQFRLSRPWKTSTITLHDNGFKAFSPPQMSDQFRPAESRTLSSRLLEQLIVIPMAQSSSEWISRINHCQESLIEDSERVTLSF